MRTWMALGIAFLGFSLAARAQEDPKQKFTEAQKQNRAALMQYTWKTRTELAMKGETKSVKQEQVRYDIDGKPHKTPIGGAPEPATEEQPARRGRRGGRVKEKIIENKKEEFAELMKSLGELVGSYGHLPPDKLQAFVQNATLTPGQGSLEIRGASVLQEGDSLTVQIDTATYMTRRVEIRTALEGKPVTATSDYRALSNGPTYQARSVLEYPDKEIVLTIENFDYQKLGQ